MASPQQMPGPNRPTRVETRRRPADVREIRTREAPGPGAGWFAWWWIWLIVILCAIWFAGWGWGGYGGWWWGNRGSVSTSGYPGTANGTLPGNAGATGTVAGTAGTATMNMVMGQGAPILTATDKRPYIGHRFQVSDAVVMKKVSEHVLWIGQSTRNSDAASVLVILSGAAGANVAQGDLVNVAGTVAKAPAAGQAQASWKLSGDEAKRLEQQGAYVAAGRIRSAAQGAGNNG